jgi:RNA polymerase sigma-70 factor (ECF subfamily)
MQQEEQVDLHLIVEVQKGNKQAFDALVLKYQYKVFKLVARYISDPSEVLDVTQETFIKAYKALDNFRGDSSFYTWLYRIAVNTAKNHLIARGRRLPESEYEISEIEQFLSKRDVKEYSTPERTLICDEMEHMLFDIIDDLPSDLRTAILLREIEGLTYEEISEVMGCPVGTVRSRIFRAREAIEKKIDPYMNKEAGGGLD